MDSESDSTANTINGEVKEGAKKLNDGFLFGYAMEKAKVYEPIAIRQQMIFRRFIMLKMFLAALATSTFSIFLVAIIFKKRYS